MAKNFDVQLLNTVVREMFLQAFREECRVEPEDNLLICEKEIHEYNSGMRVFPMEKFNEPAYVAVVNGYLTEKHMQVRKASGTFVLFVKADVAARLFQSFGHFSKETENEEQVMDAAGKFCSLAAGKVIRELSGKGYSELLLSPALAYKNSVPDGVPFDYSLFHKQELTLSFWKEKSVVLEVCMGHVPLKNK